MLPESVKQTRSRDCAQTTAKCLSDGGDPVRQHGLQGQVMAITV